MKGDTSNQLWFRSVPLRGLRIDRLWFFAVLLAVFLRTNLQPAAPYDLWWHMKVGEIIVQTGQIPRVDEFSFTMAGEAYDNYAQFWLVECLYYVAFRFGGLPLLVLLNSLMVTLAYAILLSASGHQAGPRSAVVGVSFAAVLGFTNWTLRPQSLALPLAATLLWCVRKNAASGSRSVLFLIPLILLVWANVHGSWILGVVFLLIWLAACVHAAAGREKGIRELIKDVRIPALVVLSSLVAVLINPRGVRIMTYLLAMSQAPIIRLLAPEWDSATFEEPIGAFFLAGLMLSSLLLMLSPRRPSVSQLLVYLAYGMLGLKMIRGSVWYGLFMAPVVADHVSVLADRLRAPVTHARHAAASSMRYGLSAAILAIMLLLAILSTPWLKSLLPLPAQVRLVTSDDTPIRAVEFMMRNELGPEVFHEQRFGSYLIWAASSKYRVYVDARLELYTVALAQEYFEISAAAPGWEEQLARRGIRTLMLSPKYQAELIRAADESTSWSRLYADDRAVVFAKQD